MKRERIIRKAAQELSSEGYSTVLASNMHTCADVFAERKGNKFIIKIVYNIDSVARKEAEALRKLSQFMDAKPILLGSISQNSRLKDNVNYRRFSLRCISPEMLPNMSSNELALFASKSVGVKVKVDSRKLQTLRKASGMTVSDLMKMTGLSCATIHKHERMDAYAAAHTVAKLENILNGSIRAENLPLSDKANYRTNELARTGMRSLRLEKAPFDIVTKSKNYYEISLDANIRTLIKRASLFKGLRENFEGNYPFFISEKKGGRINGMPVLRKKDLMKVHSEEELLDLVY